MHLNEDKVKLVAPGCQYYEVQEFAFTEVNAEQLPTVDITIYPVDSLGVVYRDVKTIVHHT